MLTAEEEVSMVHREMKLALVTDILKVSREVIQYGIKFLVTSQNRFLAESKMSEVKRKAEVQKCKYLNILSNIP